MIFSAIIPQDLRTTASPTFNTVNFTKGTANLEIFESSNGLAIRRTDAAGTIVRVFPNAVDTAESIGYAFGWKINAFPSFTAAEFVNILYSTTLGAFVINSSLQGSGTGYAIRPIQIYTGSDSDQLYISTNGRIGIQTNVPGSTLDVVGTGHFSSLLRADTAIQLGDPTAVQIVYDVDQLVISSNLSTASDIVLECGTDKTLVLDESVYKDINLAGAVLSGIPAQEPGRDEFVDETGTDTGISTYAVAVGEGVDGSFELQHDYKEGTDLLFHVHWQGIDAPTGTDNVRWSLTYAIARNDTTLNAPATIEIETAFDTQYELARSDLPAIDGETLEIGDQFLFRLERIASTGDAYAGDALLATVGIHYEIDTLGSRTLGSK
jgi:hypothetical protein